MGGNLGKYSLGRAANAVKVLIEGRPQCLGLARSLVAGKRGIEIGGPSGVFRKWHNLPIYDVAGSLDNCDFSQATKWATHTAEYRFSKRKPAGRVYFCEGSDLSEVPDGAYDFLLSSHNLEHFANPMKGLREWQRVVRRGGHMVLVLPHYARTFDHRRRPTPLAHMMEDYERGTGEEDLTHVEEIFEAHRLNDPSRTDEELRALLMDNFSHRMMHHHVFDEANSRELMEAAGMKVLALETKLPFHIILLLESS